MSRKHDYFTYGYGLRCAPEQWGFAWNHKPIQLDSSTRSRIACLIIAGKKKEAMDELKRLLRKQEKEENYICYGFFGEGENNRKYYFTQDLRCKKNASLQEKLQAYKNWKGYIREKNCFLSNYVVTDSYLDASGKMVKRKEEEIQEKVNLNRPCIINLYVSDKEKIFQF